MSAHPTFREALRFWFKLGLISFGGPTGQIAVMHTELVERKRWIGEQRFLHALNYCMLLPGPEATQLATYCGWLLHRTWGGIAAGVLFVLPSALILWGLSAVYVTWGQIPWIAAAFDGLKPAVTAIVAAATLRIGARALRTPVLWLVAAFSFIAIFFYELPFPAILGAAAVLGWAAGARWPDLFPSSGGHSSAANDSVVDDRQSVSIEAPTLARGLRVSTVCLALWWTPILVLGLWLGWESAQARQAIFFSKAAMVTFGGAYAVLPYVGQQAVEQYGWLTATQMLDGLGLAETTPGPLIMVVQFVGFLGGWQSPTRGFSPLGSATLSAAITTWVTFVPCFFWIFLGAPYIERMRGNAVVSRTLTAVTAAVVGVIANLAVWFAWHALFPGSQVNLAARGPATVLHVDALGVLIALVAFVAMHRWKVGIIPVVLCAAAAGLLRHAAGL